MEQQGFENIIRYNTAAVSGSLDRNTRQLATAVSQIEEATQRAEA